MAYSGPEKINVDAGFEHVTATGEREMRHSITNIIGFDTPIDAGRYTLNVERLNREGIFARKPIELLELHSWECMMGVCQELWASWMGRLHENVIHLQHEWETIYVTHELVCQAAYATLNRPGPEHHPPPGPPVKGDC